MAGIEYYFNNLDPFTFQRLINTILVARFGENIRLTPLFGSDGGKDGETSAHNPFFEFHVDEVEPNIRGIVTPPQKGRYIFQVKYHRTLDTRMSDIRKTVITEFEKELEKNVLQRKDQERVNYFFLITNVPSSEKSIAEVDRKQSELQKSFPYLYAEVWWRERIESFLDQMPLVWNSFPSLFAGGKIPFLAEVTDQENKGIPRAIRVALERQYRRDSNVKFRQIDLEKNLSKLFVDLDINVQQLSVEEKQKLLIAQVQLTQNTKLEGSTGENDIYNYSRALYNSRHQLFSALTMLLDENIITTRKIILEGGPGQGKSTITQMVVQIYRQQILHKDDMKPEGRWNAPQKSRLPFRIELRSFAEWLSKESGNSIEEYLASTIKQDSGGSPVTVDDIHNMVEKSPIMLVLDGLDEVGSDDLRNEVLVKIVECIQRFENDLFADLRVIVTTRPPTVASCNEHLTNFTRFPIAPMEANRIKNYVNRWISVQLHDEDDKREVQESFQRRQNEPHVQAIAKNPMQLSVLLHFIRLKGVAFPDRRAELYREYFRTVIDRDVEKSSSLREQREVIESLHQFLGYKIHALAEAEQSDGSLDRTQLLQLVESWLKARGNVSKTSLELFKLGEERLGLIVALKGEGEDARYGYEIQPIREYFAAAFINDDIEGNAHDVFQAMVRRSYWKEVALFLAGLRRPNEKADLVARAKALDKDDKLGWRQDGRHLTLQLLQEGVFSQPPHVFTEALDFVFDFLDPILVKVQNEPKDLLKVLPPLLKQEQAAEKRYIDRLLKLLQTHRTSEDEFALYRLYRIASQILGLEEMKRALLSYEGSNPEILARVRVLWSSMWKIDMHEAASKDFFWESVPNDIWAIVLWNAIARFNLASNPSLPSFFHQYLLEQFAINQISTSHLGSLSIKEESEEWAVLKLTNYQKMLEWLEDIGSTKVQKAVNQFLSLNESSNIDFVGLDQEAQEEVSNLIRVSHNVLKNIFNNEDQLPNVFEDYISTMHKYFEQPGLIGWLACRCTLNLLQYIIFLFGRHRPKAPKYLNFQVYCNRLWNGLKIFYLNEKTSHREDFETTSIEFRVSTLMNLDRIPRYIRLERNGEFADVVDLLAENVCIGKDLPFNWMKRMPLTTWMIRPLVEKCREYLPSLLIFLSSRYFVQVTYGSPLLTYDVQRILKIARAADDPQILSGALIALSSSKFLRLAGPKLVLKLIRSDLSKAKFAIPLFQRQYTDEGVVSVREIDREIDTDSREIINEIANSILASPDDYNFLIVSTAANYLAEYSQVSLPALLHLEDELKLHVYSK